MDIFNQMQQILQMLLNTAEVGVAWAVCVLAGYALFKLVTMASYIYFARFVVIKIYELLTQSFSKARIYHLRMGENVLVESAKESGAIDLKLAIELVAEKHTYKVMSITELRKLSNYIRNYNPKKDYN